ncbi:MAG: hypothetical protein E7335_05310 [Clostridiales bacterium]|nr:hypothetical protein [Clostridiales bacterium]
MIPGEVKVNMLKIYEEEYIVRMGQCDRYGKWRPSAILAAMQDAAGTHSEKLDCGRAKLLEKNLVWVLTRTEVRMQRYPSSGEKVLIRTFPAPNKRWFFPRYYLFIDEAGNEIGKAGTLWVLLDFETRKMAPPGEAAALLPDNSDLELPLGMPPAIPQVEGEDSITLRMPVYTDIDVNGHVNNTRYADWACDALGIDIMEKYEPASILVNYAQEIMPGQEMELHAAADGTHYRVSGKFGEKVHFELGGELRKRD